MLCKSAELCEKAGLCRWEQGPAKDKRLTMAPFGVAVAERGDRGEGQCFLGMNFRWEEILLLVTQLRRDEICGERGFQFGVRGLRRETEGRRARRGRVGDGCF